MHHRNRWRHRRAAGALAGFLWSAAALPWPVAAHGAEPAGKPRPAPAGTPLSGFITELSPRFDDVFPDSLEYQRIIDRFLDLTTTMRGVCDNFARAAQEALSEANATGDKALLADAATSPRACALPVARAYARAQSLGQQYLRIGRELNRHHEQVRELDRLGDSQGLTPDYRAKVKLVLKTYDSLLADYREMKATFHDELTDELRFLGCDPAQLLALAGEKAEAPGTEAAPPGPPALPVEPGRPAGVEVAARASLSGLGLTFGAAVRSALPGPDPHPRNSIQFYVDNTRCRRAHHVFLDGAPVGEIDGAARASFRSTAGPHELCLISQEPTALPREARPAAVPQSGPGQPAVRDAVARAESPPSGSQCGDPGTVRHSYFHEGWTIALRCE